MKAWSAAPSPAARPLTRTLATCCPRPCPGATGSPRRACASRKRGIASTSLATRSPASWTGAANTAPQASSAWWVVPTERAKTNGIVAGLSQGATRCVGTGSCLASSNARPVRWVARATPCDATSRGQTTAARSRTRIAVLMRTLGVQAGIRGGACGAPASVVTAAPALTQMGTTSARPRRPRSPARTQWIKTGTSATGQRPSTSNRCAFRALGAAGT